MKLERFNNSPKYLYIFAYIFLPIYFCLFDQRLWALCNPSANQAVRFREGGCKKFCVTGHKAGNCRHFERSRNDRSKSTTRRANRQPAV